MKSDHQGQSEPHQKEAGNGLKHDPDYPQIGLKPATFVVFGPTGNVDCIEGVGGVVESVAELSGVMYKEGGDTHDGHNDSYNGEYPPEKKTFRNVNDA